jgi:hypothetical protein
MMKVHAGGCFKEGKCCMPLALSDGAQRHVNHTPTVLPLLAEPQWQT